MRIAKHRGGGASRPLFLCRVLITLFVISVHPAAGAADASPAAQTLQSVVDVRAAVSIRFATYNASLNRSGAGELVRDLSTPDNAQARRIAEVIQRVRPDVLLINEFDFDTAGESARLFEQNYLGRAQRNAAPIRYPYRYTAAVNTGVPSGLDLDNDGRIGGGGDALGFGQFPGQYGLVVYSRYPIDLPRVRSFQRFLWRDMPGAVLPPDWYSAEELAVLPLSSKSHWDLPLKIGAGKTLHFLVSHPTPPAFDGPEDRNGRRNHDEIRLWADYLTPAKAGYLRDDRGQRGGLAAEAAFVIAGDLNADAVAGASFNSAIRQLLDHPRIRARPTPRSAGAEDAARRQGGNNLAQQGDAAEDTADFGDRGNGPGNLRADYVLPSTSLPVCGSGVFWPRSDDPLFELVNDDTAATSDHRLVWLDIAAPASGARAHCTRSATPTGQ